MQDRVCRSKLFLAWAVLERLTPAPVAHVKYNRLMQFAKLCEIFSKIEATPKRLEKMALLAEILRECEAGEVRQAVYLSLGFLRPKYDKLEFNMAEKMVMRALANAMGKTTSEVEVMYKKIGDLGEVAEKAGEVRQGHGQTVTQIYDQLTHIANERGVGSQERKVAGLVKLLVAATTTERKYVVRMVLAKLRLGFSDKTILDTLSFVDAGDKSARQELDAMYQVAPDVGELAYQVKSIGVVKAREKIAIRLGRPVIPALAQRLPTADEMIAKMGKVTVEPKYDGTRVQIHFSRSEKSVKKESQEGLFEKEKPDAWVRTFTRNLDESSAMFPELENIGAQIKAQEVILDAEAVGFDPKSGQLVPFQLTITRKRKHGVEAARASVPLKFFVFDILYKDGQSLIKLPLYKRREVLAQTIQGESTLVVDQEVVTEKAEEVRDYHKIQLGFGLEGAMVKKYDGEYMPGRQGFNWVKLKEEEGQKGKLLDTIDAVVMGYYKGKGKRSGFGLGAFLIGIRGEDEQILTIAKIGTGLSDEVFRLLYTKLKLREIDRKDDRYQVAKMLEPDVWVAPEVVVEVAADEVTVSPQHSSGYALRFPRLVKIREDKGVGEITELAELKTLI